METQNKNYLSILEEYTEIPGARDEEEGENSGHDFLEKVLEKAFAKALNEKQKLVVNLDGVEGFATSFLEEAFGGLARKYTPAIVLSTLEFISINEPLLIEEIQQYISEANAK